jgi:hypothetical protein
MDGPLDSLVGYAERYTLGCIAFARCRAILAQDVPGPIQKGIAEVRISILSWGRLIGCGYSVLLLMDEAEKLKGTRPGKPAIPYPYWRVKPKASRIECSKRTMSRGNHEHQLAGSRGD